MTFKNRWLTLSIVLGSSLVATAAAAGSYTMKQITISKTTLRGDETFIETKVKNETLAIRSFNFEFESGDHKLRSLGVSASGESIQVSLADANSDDPYKFDTSWKTLPKDWTTGMQTAKKTDCKGTCKVPINSNIGWTKPRVLITGFKFSRPSGDRNIQRIAIRPNMPIKNSVVDKKNMNFDVTFQDGGSASDNPFSVEITYVAVAAGWCLHYGSVSGNKKGKEQVLNIESEEGLKLLSGFDVKFSTGDHHLKRFGIAPSGKGFAVHLNDKNFDDEVNAVIDYCVFDEAGAKAGVEISP